MTQGDEEVARAAFAAFEQRNVTDFLALIADDVVTHRIDPDDAVYHGKEGFFQATAEWTEDFEDWTVTAEEFFEGRDGVLARVRQNARGRVSGVPVESLMWFEMRIHEGRIARITFYTDRARAFEAAGLSE